MLATRTNVTGIKMRFAPMTLKDGWTVPLISPDSKHNYFPHEGKVCRRHPDSIGLSKKWGHRCRLILNQFTLSRKYMIRYIINRDRSVSWFLKGLSHEMDLTFDDMNG
jgi:hypothetical protein